MTVLTSHTGRAGAAQIVVRQHRARGGGVTDFLLALRNRSDGFVHQLFQPQNS